MGSAFLAFRVLEGATESSYRGEAKVEMEILHIFALLQKPKSGSWIYWAWDMASFLRRVWVERPLLFRFVTTKETEENIANMPNQREIFLFGIKSLAMGRTLLFYNKVHVFFDAIGFHSWQGFWYVPL